MVPPYIQMYPIKFKLLILWLIILNKNQSADIIFPSTTGVTQTNGLSEILN
jgi:hypothetical protein